MTPYRRGQWTNYPFALQRGDLSLSRRDCLCAVEDSAEIMLDWWLFKGSLNMDALATNTVKHEIFSMLVRKTKILLRVILESNNFISITSWTVLICSGQRLSALDSAYLPWTALICPGQCLSTLDSTYLPWTALICPGHRLSALDSAYLPWTARSLTQYWFDLQYGKNHYSTVHKDGRGRKSIV